jgi:hypothetical protein
MLAGDTWEWTRELADYPATAWSAVVYFEKADASFSVSGVASGTAHVFTISATTTAGYRAGKYRWRLAVFSEDVRKTVEEGYTEVQPDPAAAGNFDHRTTARVALENIEAFLRDPTNLQAASYSLGGRSLSRWSRADLLVERDKWKLEAKSESAAERIAAGLGNPRRLYVRFDRI